MEFASIVAASHRVAASSARKDKIAVLADVVRSTPMPELAAAVHYLSGLLPQGSVGLGYSSLADLPAAATATSLTLADVDRALSAIAEMSGDGAATSRRAEVAQLLGRATPPEQEFLRALLLGGLRQGSGEKLMLDAIAKAYGVPIGLVRRAAMFAGSAAAVAVAAASGGKAEVAAIELQIFRPVEPMLAKTVVDIAAGVDQLGTAAVEAKLDGARIQVHRRGDEVRIFTRNLNDVTDRLPEIVAAVSDYQADSCVLDGEAIGIGPDGRPLSFQVTMGRFGTSTGDADIELSAFFFDLLYLNDGPVLDLPAAERFATLDRLVPAAQRVRRIVTSDAVQAAAFMDEVIAAGHEGVVLKSLDSGYKAGRRGSGWLKVKPVHTLDLVVLAVEWGSGRRQGWLSNIHVGARAPDGGFVMLGKTFKGMTDEILEWQTKRFLELETHRKGHIVYVRPEQVVEIAYDGIQASTRYPGGMALRFARVKGYRDDKTAADADTVETVRTVFAGDGRG